MDRIIRYIFLILLFFLCEMIGDNTNSFSTSIAAYLFQWMSGFVLVRGAYRDGVKDSKKVKF